MCAVGQTVPEKADDLGGDPAGPGVEICQGTECGMAQTPLFEAFSEELLPELTEDSADQFQRIDRLAPVLPDVRLKLCPHPP